MKNLLVTGASGQLGYFVKKALGQVPALGADAVYADRTQLDLADPRNIESFFKKNGSFKIIMNLAAYTNVDLAEKERELAWQINAEAPAQIGVFCERMIHISTDYVFDGTKNSPYSENDQVHPLSYYGETKHAGEVKLLQSHGHASVIRTSWLYSELPGNFLTKIVQFAKVRPELKIVSDQKGTPTYAADLAKVLVSTVKNGAAAGVYHYSNDGETTWYDFAKYFLDRLNIKTPVAPIPSSEYPTPARRPAYSVLDKSKIKREMNLKISPWQESVNVCLSHLS